MRIASIITALLVVTGIYFFVFERDAVKDFAGTDPAAEQAGGETAETQVDATPPAAREKGETAAIKVVARHSVARELDSAVVLRGETEAARSIQVAAETSGRVISTPLRKGAYVDEGQMLCELDAGTRSASLAQARAAVKEAEVALANARKLSEGGYASETAVLSAEAAVEAARAAQAQAENEIENLTITAPFAGLLESDTAELGQLMQPGSVCATVIQLDPIKLVGFAPEAEVDRIEVGTLAGAQLISGQEVTGRVTFLSRSADPATRTFRVEVEVPNPDFAIRDGQTVEMAVRSEGKLAHLVAQSTLTLDDEGALGVRIVDADNRVAFVPVSVVRDTREGVWVTGLPEEVDVITVGQEYVRSGVLVEPHFEEISQ
ncbi:efflux RND transporter periplasmic adaptor subunit [Celeribacter sp.]|uniref:efflux RND transporter periplasmic adaptor subunit n=1 Tax=Celeribacter sp. TaxID=1890673 RepID=UPI003A949D30